MAITIKEYNAMRDALVLSRIVLIDVRDGKHVNTDKIVITLNNIKAALGGHDGP